MSRTDDLEDAGLIAEDLDDDRCPDCGVVLEDTEMVVCDECRAPYEWDNYVERNTQ